MKPGQSFPARPMDSPRPRRRLSFIAVSALAWHATSPLWAMNPALTGDTEVVPGLHLLTYSIAEPATEAVYVLRLDLGRPELTLRVGFAHGTIKGSREPLTDIVRRYNAPGHEVLAAVNASFFEADGTPVGAVMDAGSLLKTFRGWNRAVFGWTPSHRPLSANALNDAGAGVFLADGSSAPIHDINDPPAGNELTLFTPGYASATGTLPACTEVTLRGVNFPLSPAKSVEGTVSAVTGGNSPVPGDGLVLSASGTAADLVRRVAVGDRLRVRTGLNDPLWNAANLLLTGAGWIVREGTPATELWERYPEKFRVRHPRTLVGWDDEFLYLVAVDGRQPGYSDGMSFSEMAEFMKDTLACQEAVNFDGGGSTTMVVGGSVVNRPSDGQERPLPNALLVVSSPATSPLPLEDPFLPAGRKLFWRDRFTMNPTERFDPPSPNGDGCALRVSDPAGGFESVRAGRNADRNYSVSAWFYCHYRPELADAGFDRVALFARDAGDGAFDDPSAGSSNCYALMWDSNDGRLRAGRFLDGTWSEAVDQPTTLPSTSWRRFRIDCREDHIAWLVDGAVVAEATDTLHPSGPCGVAYREEFEDNGHILGAVVDDFVMAPVTSAVPPPPR